MQSLAEIVALLGTRLRTHIGALCRAAGARHRADRRRLLRWMLAGLVLAQGAARAALWQDGSRPRIARSGRQIWINPAGSNTPPWDTEAKGAPDFATVETAVAAGDEIVLSDTLHSFTSPVRLFPNNLLLAAGDSVFVRSKSRDASLCKVAASGAPVRLLDLDFVRGAPPGQGLAVQFEGIHFENKVATGTQRGKFVKCVNDVTDLSFLRCAFSFSLPVYDGSNGSRQCIDFSDTVQTRTVLFDGCDFDDIVVAGTSIVRTGASSFLHLRGCRLGNIDSSWTRGEFSGGFARVEGGAAVEDLRVEGPFVVRALAAAGELRGAVIGNVEPQAVTIDGADVANITVDLSAAPAASCTGVFLYSAGNAADLLRHCSFHHNVRVGENRIIGGLVCVKDDGHRATVEDSEAFANEGFYGALAYCTTGGAFDLRRCQARSNLGGFDAVSGAQLNGLAVYIGGGAYDCTLDAVVIHDHDAVRGPAIYMRNSDTPANPGPRTVTLRHVTVFGNRSSDAIEPGAIQIQAEAVGTFTVNAVNCVFDNPECGLEISSGEVGSMLNLTLVNCFTPDGAALDIEAPNGSFSDVAPLTGVSRLDPVGRPYADSQLVNAGADTQGEVPADAEGTPWNSLASPTVGGLEVAAPVDTDGDGVSDEADNCTLTANSGQRDTNADGFGNLCDADLNNDCIVNNRDVQQARAVFGTNNPNADLNGNGIVDASDLQRVLRSRGSPPGPSGIASCD